MRLHTIPSSLLSCVLSAGVLTACGASGGDDTPTPTAAASSIEVAPLVSGDLAAGNRDAMPGPGGERIYFVGDGSGRPGLFSVPSGGGEATTVVTSFEIPGEGGPSMADFEHPMGIVVSADGVRAYIADRDAMAGEGAIVEVDLSAGTAEIRMETVGMHPTAVELRPGQEGDDLYFTGESLEGLAGVFHIPQGEVQPTGFRVGAPLTRPTGLCVSEDGVVYVADNDAGGEGRGKVFEITGDAIEALVDEVKGAEPAGIALTEDEGTVLLSSMNADTGHDQVLIIDRDGGGTSIFDDVIGQNTQGGGLHRAPRGSGDVFAWADFTGVYSVRIH